MADRAFGLIASSVWYTSERFKRCTPAARLVFLWLLTGDHGNAAGIFRFVPAMIPETAAAPAQARRALGELESVGLVSYDPRARLLMIRQFIRFAPIRSWQHATAACNTLSALGASTLTEEIAVEVSRSAGFRKLIERDNAKSAACVARFYAAFEGGL